MSENQLAGEPPAADAIDPAAVAAADPVNPPVDPQPDPPAEPTPSAKTPWFMERIAVATQKKQEAIEAQERAEKRARDAEELLARLQRGATPADPPPQDNRRAAPNQDEFNQAVTREAARQRLFEDSTAVRTAGMSEFPDFAASLQALQTMGATSDDFILDVLAVDKGRAHVILDKLAKDPERASSLANMDSRRRISELTRMAIAEGKPTAKAAEPQSKPAAVSRAPAPKPAIEPAAVASETDWMNPDKLDKMSEAEANEIFSRNWEAKWGKRKSA